MFASFLRFQPRLTWQVKLFLYFVFFKVYFCEWPPHHELKSFERTRSPESVTWDSQWIISRRVRGRLAKELWNVSILCLSKERQFRGMSSRWLFESQDCTPSYLCMPTRKLFFFFWRDILVMGQVREGCYSPGDKMTRCSVSISETEELGDARDFLLTKRARTHHPNCSLSNVWFTTDAGGREHHWLSQTHRLWLTHSHALQSKSPSSKVAE